MAVYKDGDKWRVIYRYTNYKGERKQTQKRGFATKRKYYVIGENHNTINVNIKMYIFDHLKMYRFAYSSS